MPEIEIGRNEPCPCLSGKKYKKCCLGKAEAVVTGGARDVDVVALVDAAVARDDWESIREMLAAGLALFEPGAPLEYVRFPDDVFAANAAGAIDAAARSRMCASGWLRRCETAIEETLDRVADLEPLERDGLRLAVHLVRRFGAQSPVVAEIATTQQMERAAHASRLAAQLRRFALSTAAIADGFDLVAWIERDKPMVLPFTDWFALAVSGEIDGLWKAGTARRVAEVCFVRAESATDAAGAKPYLQLAAHALAGEDHEIGRALARLTEPILATADERTVFAAMTAEQRGPIPSLIGKIITAAANRGDFAGAAILRDTALRISAEVRARKFRGNPTP